VLKLGILYEFCSISRVLGDTTRNMDRVPDGVSSV